MKKIRLVETKSSHLHVYSNIPIPRLGAVLLGTLLKERGYDVGVYIEEFQEVDIADLLDADLVGISVLTSTTPRSYHIAKILRDAGIPVVLGGTHVTFEPDEALDHADYVVTYEGEDTFLELIEALERGGDVSSIPGLSYNADDSKQHNPPRPLLNDLDSLPLPDFSLVVGGFSGSVVSVSTARGCPFDCSFCSVTTFNGKQFRAASVDRVLTEIDYHLSHYPVRYLFFADDIFNYNRKRTKEILRGMIENRLTPPWSAQVRHEASRDEEMLELMYRSNCERLFVGFESINQRTLDLFDKRETVQNIKDAITSFHNHRIKIHGMFVVGSDEDDVQTIQDTRKFAQEWDIDSSQFMILTPIPGSRDYQPFKSGERELLTRDWSLYDGHHALHTPARMSAYELQVEAMQAMRDFYSWSSIWKRLLRGDIYEAVLRKWGKDLIGNWYRDEENLQYVEWLRNGEPKQTESIPLQRQFKLATGVVALAPPPPAKEIAALLEAFFEELGVRVIYAKKNLLEFMGEQQEILATRRERIATQVYRYMADLKAKADYVIVPIVKDLERYQNKLLAEIDAVSTSLRAVKANLPRIVQLRVDGDDYATFLTKVGLMFTTDRERIQNACLKALAFV